MTTQGSGGSISTGPRPPAPQFGGRPGGGGRSGGGRFGGRSGGRSGGRPGGGRRGGRPRYYARRKLCAFCVDHIDYIDYKEVDKFRRFVTDRYKIESRRKTGVCAKHQRGLSTAIKRARHLALVPFSPDHADIGPRYSR
ncbi:MAG TPA: 30S ribosomal protein S18 [Dehalococcoidia bacterium]|nr:30S ribosomal protein S18 [Dehalococcoidia bacterium]HCH10018.1 30S ribosomal protein S18 [Dehalococcoidia bacterium]HIO62653.1 30S ribosomal protein S18 [Dehalococcoidia bacterium]